MASANPTKRRTRRPRAERQAEILSAARSVFSEHGYATATMSEIADRAGVVEGTVYSYFETKRALLIAVLKEFFDDLITETESGLQAVRGTENQLRYVIRRQFDTFADDLGLCRVIITEARADFALYDEAILDLNRRYTGLALGVLEAGVRAGDLRSDIVPSVIRDLIYGGIEHAVWRFIFSEGNFDLAALSDQLADAVLGGIKAPAEIPAAVQTPSGRSDRLDEAAIRRLERAVTRLESQVGG